ncbi:MAG: 2-keto-4-pentenoate hydratase [Candidatus Berkiella sp.]
MSKNLLLKSFLTCICLSYCISVWGQADVLARRLLEAHEKGQPIPTFSHETNLDMSSAYAVQTAYIKSRLAHDRVAGFKAGLTCLDAQNHMGVNRALFGVLLKSGDLSDCLTVSLQKFGQLIVETELGFITKKPIRRSVSSIAELQSYIGQIVPVVELPDMGFDKSPIHVTDLVAANAVAAAFIYSKEINWLGQDVNLITVSLSHNGKIVNQGQGEEAFGDQWEALRWLVNQVIANGWSIEKGSLLITGALGGMVTAEPGIYRAQFNNEAIITFEVTS